MVLTLTILFVGLIATRARPGRKIETQEIHDNRDFNDEGVMRNGARDTRDSCYSVKKIDPSANSSFSR